MRRYSRSSSWSFLLFSVFRRSSNWRVAHRREVIWGVGPCIALYMILKRCWWAAGWLGCWVAGLVGLKTILARALWCSLHFFQFFFLTVFAISSQLLLLLLLLPLPLLLLLVRSMAATFGPCVAGCLFCCVCPRSGVGSLWDARFWLLSLASLLFDKRDATRVNSRPIFCCGTALKKTHAAIFLNFSNQLESNV